MFGNLIKNAMEAIKDSNQSKILYVEMIESNGEFKIEVRNKSIFVPQDKMEMFFKKDYSQNGKGRGIGLYNVKTICKDYSLNILCQNKNIDGENWLSFTVDNKKRNHWNLIVANGSFSDYYSLGDLGYSYSPKKRILAIS